MLSKLYKKSSSGKIQEWEIRVVELPGGVATVVTHGQVGGNLQETTTNYLDGKNIGRSNETSPREQAESEALSKWNKQKDKGYCEDPLGVQERAAPLPILAHPYKEYQHQVDWTKAFAQPKIDGARGIATKRNGVVTLWSRLGKPILTVPHLIEPLVAMMPEAATWDGEIYAHGVPFQIQISSWFKKFSPEHHRKLWYHVFDQISEESFSDRYHGLVDAFSFSRLNSDMSVQLVRSYPVLNPVEFQALHDGWVYEGYEGAILRHGDCRYEQNKRSRYLLKHKRFLDQEFKITGAVENRGKLAGTCTFICETGGGKTFECLPRGTDEIRHGYWENHQELIGKQLTVRFFEWSEDGIPRFPTGIAVRDYGG